MSMLKTSDELTRGTILLSGNRYSVLCSACPWFFEESRIRLGRIVDVEISLKEEGWEKTENNLWICDDCAYVRRQKRKGKNYH